MIDSRRCSFAVDGIQHNCYQTYQVSHIECKTHAFEIELTLSRVQSTLHLFSTVKTGMVEFFFCVHNMIPIKMLGHWGYVSPPMCDVGLMTIDPCMAMEWLTCLTMVSPTY